MGKTYNVLFVDDEPNILASLKRGLLYESYEKFFASSGAQALEIMEKTPIAVIVTDMRMPEMDGLALLKIVKEKYPDTIKIVLSGYTQIQQVLATINQVDIYKFITKPWKMEDEFVNVIQSALEYYRLKEEKEELKIALEKKNKSYQNILKRIETLINDAKNSTGLLGEIGYNLFENITFRVNDNIDRDSLLLVLEQSMKMYREVFEHINEDVKVISLNDYIQSLSNEIRSKSTISKIDINNQISEEVKIRINIRLLSSMVLFSIDMITRLMDKDYLMIIVQKEAELEDAIKLTFLFSNVKQNERMLKSYQNNLLIDVLNNILPNILSYFNGTFACTNVGTNIAEKYIFKIYQ